MVAITPDEGLDYISERAVETPEVAVGTGTSSVSSSDSSMQSEVFRASSNDPPVDVSATTNTGEIKYQITVSGGTEVPAGTDVTEFGVFAPDGRMLYHETRSATTVEAGDRVTFAFTVTISTT